MSSRDGEGIVVDVRKEPSYDALEPADRKRVTVEVEKARQSAELHNRTWNVIVPAALDEPTRKVIERRRRDGLRTPELVDPQGNLRDCAGRWVPDSLRPHTAWDYVYYVFARPLLLLAAFAAIAAVAMTEVSFTVLTC